MRRRVVKRRGLLSRYEFRTFVSGYRVEEVESRGFNLRWVLLRLESDELEIGHEKRAVQSRISSPVATFPY